MPTSAWGYITPILDKVSSLHNDQRIINILDVGVGGGKWGFLSRDIIDFYHNSAYYKKDWELNIEGVEAFKKYKTPVHDFIYNKIHYKPVQDIEFDKSYDIIFFMEVIEHMEKEQGLKTLDILLSKATRGIFLSFPPEYDALGRHTFEQKDTHDNVFETHRSIWSEADLSKYTIEVLYFNTYFISRKHLVISPRLKTAILEKENSLILNDTISEIEYNIYSSCDTFVISTIRHPWSATILVLDDQNKQIHKESLFKESNSRTHDITLKNNHYKFIKIKIIADTKSQGNEVWIKKVTLLL